MERVECDCPEVAPERPGDVASDELIRTDLERLHVLRRVCLDSVWGLLACCDVRRLKAGECLLEAGQSNQTMFLILNGRLSVHLDRPDSDPVAFLEAGQTVGEMSVIDDSPASAYVLAAEDCRLIAVEEETFWRLVAASHEFAANLLLLLAQRMRNNLRAISAGVHMRRQLERDAMVDGLTGLYNRRWLDDRLPRLVQRHHRSAAPLCVLLIDVDHFKRFNDQFGHLAGDQVLVVVARTMQRCLRPTDLAARYGGEEFLVVLPDTSIEGGRAAAERLRSFIANARVEVSDGRVLPFVTASIGVAMLTGEEGHAALVQRADEALYRAKGAGRNRVEG